jgi:hypothetical protein
MRAVERPATWAVVGGARKRRHCGAEHRSPSDLGGTPVSNIGELNRKLDEAIFSGRALQAFEDLYDDDVVMQENTDAEYRGKDFNRKRE